MPVQSKNARHYPTLRRVCAVAALVCAPAAMPAHATEFPDHPIKLVVPFPPGGPTDLVSRVIAKKMSEDLGQQVVVDNRPGANGNIGGEMVAKAPADGYTVLYNTSSIALSPALYKKLPYDVKRDFAPVAMTAMVPLVLEVNAKVPANTVAEFVSWLKANPGKMTYGSAGNGNVTHLAAFLFLQANGLDAVHAPYKGSAGRCSARKALTSARKAAACGGSAVSWKVANSALTSTLLFQSSVTPESLTTLRQRSSSWATYLP